MSAESAAVAVLGADATLLTSLTGGVFANSDLPAEGVNRNDSQFEEVYDANGFVKPHAIVKPRAEVNSGQINDPAAQFADTRQVVEVWFYADKTATWTGIDAAAIRVYALLAEQQLEGRYRFKHVNFIEHMRDPDMGDMKFNRLDFSVIGYRGV